jgi:S-adenosylmethionine:tRNA ribosyltransferase-isomerase
VCNLQTALFDYDLPPELIAQEPARPRSASRLLVLDRETGACAHRRFVDVLDYVREGDVFVFNDSRVIRAKLLGRRVDTGGKIDFLLLRELSPGLWEALARPAKRAAPGRVFLFGDGELTATVLDRGSEGIVRLRLDCEGDLLQVLDSVGDVPLPPYIKRPLVDPADYQTVYARAPGSVAAPTAGLHFVPELLESIRARGAELHFVTLHVGLGTFRPIHTDSLQEHRMHEESVSVSAETAAAIEIARKEGRRVVAVGTTAVRTLETVGRTGEMREFHGRTNLFIWPGYEFRAVDALLTNFHLPRSTLLVLVSAFAGREKTLRAYAEAVAQRYRFYSFGDAMLIV